MADEFQQLPRGEAAVANPNGGTVHQFQLVQLEVRSLTHLTD